MSPWQPLLGLLTWSPIFKSSHCNSLEDRAPVDLIFGCPLSVWAAINVDYRDISSIRRIKSSNLNASHLVLQLPLHRRCSNYIWVINNFIAFECATYIRGFMVVIFFKCSDSLHYSKRPHLVQFSCFLWFLLPNYPLCGKWWHVFLNSSHLELDGCFCGEGGTRHIPRLPWCPH